MATSEGTFDNAEKQNSEDLNSEDRIENPVISRILYLVEQCQKSSSEGQLNYLVAIWNELYGNANYLPSIEQFFLGLFKETCKIVLSEQWTNVSACYRHQLAYAVSRCGEKLNSSVGVAQKLSTALLIAIFNPWSDDSFSNELLKNEPVELVLARVEHLLSIGNEDHATLLCENYFKTHNSSSKSQSSDGDTSNREPKENASGSSTFNSLATEEPDIMPLLERFVIMLYRRNKITDIVKATFQCSCHQGVRLVRNIQNSKYPESTALAQILTHSFLVQDLHFPSTYCCTKELMSLWCWLHVHQKTSLRRVHSAAKKLIIQHASNSAHFYLFVDMLWEQYGYRLLPLYLELYIIGLSTDLNHLDYVRCTESRLLIVELETHIASVFVKLASLFIHGQGVLARECLLSAFSLEPTVERLSQLDEMYQSAEKDSSQSNDEGNKLNAKCNNPEPEGLAMAIQECVQQQVSAGDVSQKEENEKRKDCKCEGRCSTPTGVGIDIDKFIFTHPVLDFELPGVSVNLLKDLVIVLEGIRHELMRNPNPWNILKPICEAHLEGISAMHTAQKQTQMLEGSADSETDSKSDDESIPDVTGRSLHSSMSSFVIQSEDESMFEKLLDQEQPANKEIHKIKRFLTSTGSGTKKKRKKKKRRAHKDKEKKTNVDSSKKISKKVKSIRKDEIKTHTTEDVKMNIQSLPINDIARHLGSTQNDLIVNPKSPDNVSEGSLRPINEIQTTVQVPVVLKKNKSITNSNTGTLSKLSQKSVISMKSKPKVMMKNNKSLSQKTKKIFKNGVVKSRLHSDAQVQTDITISKNTVVGSNFSSVMPVPNFIAMKGPKIPETDYGLNFPSAATSVTAKKDFMPVFKETVTCFTNTLTVTLAPRSRTHKNPVYYPVDCKYSLPNELPSTHQTSTSSPLLTTVASKSKTTKIVSRGNNSVKSSVMLAKPLTVQKSNNKTNWPQTNKKVIALVSTKKTPQTGVQLQFATPTTQTALKIPVPHPKHTIRNQKVVQNLLISPGNINQSITPGLAKQLSAVTNGIVYNKPSTCVATPLNLLVVPSPSNLVNKSLKTKNNNSKRKSLTQAPDHHGKLLYQKSSNPNQQYITLGGTIQTSTNSLSSRTTPVMAVATPATKHCSNQTTALNLKCGIKTSDSSLKLPSVLDLVGDPNKVVQELQKPKCFIKKSVSDKTLPLGTSKKVSKVHIAHLKVAAPVQSTRLVPTSAEPHQNAEPITANQTCTGTGGISNFGDSAIGTPSLTSDQPLDSPSSTSLDLSIRNKHEVFAPNQVSYPDTFVVNDMVLPPPSDNADFEVNPELGADTSCVKTETILTAKRAPKRERKSSSGKKNKTSTSKIKLEMDLSPISLPGANVMSPTRSCVTTSNTATSISNASLGVSSVTSSTVPMQFVPLCVQASVPQTCTTTTTTVATANITSFVPSTLSTSPPLSSSVVPVTTMLTTTCSSKTVTTVKSFCKKNSACTTEEVLGMIESITTATARLQMEKEQKAALKAVVSQSDAAQVKRKKRKSVGEQDAPHTSPRECLPVRAVCPDCGRGLASCYNLKRHMKNVHNKVMPIQSLQPSSCISSPFDAFNPQPFDSSIPQLHIAEDEDQFSMLDEAFPPLLSPPSSTSLEKVSDCTSLSETGKIGLLSDAVSDSSTFTQIANVSTSDSICNPTTSNSDLTPLVEKSVSDLDIFSELCAPVTAPSTGDVTKNSSVIQNNLFDTSGDNAASENLHMYQQNVPTECVNQEASAIKHEPNNTPTVCEAAWPADMMNLDQLMKPDGSDLDFFEGKSDLAYDILSNEAKPDINSTSDDAFPFSVDLSRFEAINENSHVAKSRSSKTKSSKSSNVKIPKETDVSEPNLLKELFGSENSYTSPAEKCKSSQEILPLYSAQHVMNVCDSAESNVMSTGDLYNLQEKYSACDASSSLISNQNTINVNEDAVTSLATDSTFVPPMTNEQMASHSCVNDMNESALTLPMVTEHSLFEEQSNVKFNEHSYTPLPNNNPLPHCSFIDQSVVENSTLSISQINQQETSYSTLANQFGLEMSNNDNAVTVPVRDEQAVSHPVSFEHIVSQSSFTGSCTGNVDGNVMGETTNSNSSLAHSTLNHSVSNEFNNVPLVVPKSSDNVVSQSSHADSSNIELNDSTFLNTLSDEKMALDCLFAEPVVSSETLPVTSESLEPNSIIVDQNDMKAGESLHNDACSTSTYPAVTENFNNELMPTLLHPSDDKQEECLPVVSCEPITQCSVVKNQNNTETNEMENETLPRDEQIASPSLLPNEMVIKKDDHQTLFVADQATFQPHLSDQTVFDNTETTKVESETKDDAELHFLLPVNRTNELSENEPAPTNFGGETALDLLSLIDAETKSKDTEVSVPVISKVNSSNSMPTESKTVHKADSKTVHKTDSKTVHKTHNKTTHKTDSKTIHKTDSKTVHKTDSKTVHKTDSKRVHKTDYKRVHKTDYKRVHKTESKKVHKTESKKVHKTESKTVHNIGSNTVHNKGKNTVSSRKQSSSLPADHSSKSKKSHTRQGSKGRVSSSSTDFMSTTKVKQEEDLPVNVTDESVKNTTSDRTDSDKNPFAVVKEEPKIAASDNPKPALSEVVKSTTKVKLEDDLPVNVTDEPVKNVMSDRTESDKQSFSAMKEETKIAANDNPKPVACSSSNIGFSNEFLKFLSISRHDSDGDDDFEFDNQIQNKPSEFQREKKTSPYSSSSQCNTRNFGEQSGTNIRQTDYNTFEEKSSKEHTESELQRWKLEYQLNELHVVIEKCDDFETQSLRKDSQLIDKRLLQSSVLVKKIKIENTIAYVAKDTPKSKGRPRKFKNVVKEFEDAVEVQESPKHVLNASRKTSSGSISPSNLRRMSQEDQDNKAVNIHKQLHSANVQSDSSSSVHSGHCEHRLSHTYENKVVHIGMDDLNRSRDGSVSSDEKDVEASSTDSSSSLSHKPCVKTERTLLDYCDTFMETSKSKCEAYTDDDTSCTKNSAELSVAVRGSSRIRESKVHGKRTCLCCVDSVPSPSTAKKCRMNSGSSNGSSGTFAPSSIVPLVPTKTSNFKSLTDTAKKKKKSKIASNINTRSMPKLRTRSMLVP